MKLTKDESRALAFVGFVIALAGGVRIAGGAPEWSGAAAGTELDLDSMSAAAEVAIQEKERRSKPLARGEKLDPNTASAVDLDRLPRVGAGLAEKIVQAREKRPFRTLADLTRVPGIGPATLERLAPHLTLPDGSAASRGDAANGSTPGRGDAGVGSTSRRGDAATRRGYVSEFPTSLAARSPADRTESRSDSAGSEGDAAVVDVNTATAAELETLPGIGPALAARIVEWRTKNGRFPTVDALERVAGIGPTKLEALRSRVRVQE